MYTALLDLTCAQSQDTGEKLGRLSLAKTLDAEFMGWTEQGKPFKKEQETTQTYYCSSI